MKPFRLHKSRTDGQWHLTCYFPFVHSLSFFKFELAVKVMNALGFMNEVTNVR